MAYPNSSITTRALLQDYCLRRLGHPVVEINVDDEQISDRIDDALEFVYFDASPEDKLILEYIFGIKGKKRMSVADIAKKLNKTESYVRTRLKKLALRIKLSM